MYNLLLRPKPKKLGQTILILNPLFIQFSPAEKRGGVLANLTFQL
jgi:hypothetical protein